MSRAAFNDVATFFFGPGTATPGAVRQVVAARFVLETRISNTSPFPVLYEAHITYQGASSSAGNTTLLPPILTWDLSTADIVEMASSPGAFWMVVLAQRVVPRSGTPYRRVFVTTP